MHAIMNSTGTKLLEKTKAMNHARGYAMCKLYAYINYVITCVYRHSGVVVRKILGI